jgi:hypothetical protein
MPVLSWPRVNISASSTGSIENQYTPSTKLESGPECCQPTSSHNSDQFTQVFNTEHSKASKLVDAHGSLPGADGHGLPADQRIKRVNAATFYTGTTSCSHVMFKVG